MSVARRSFLLALAGLLVDSRSGLAERGGSQTAHRTEKTAFVNLIGSLQNPYHRWWSKGGETCAAAFKAPYVLLESEGLFSKNGLPKLSSEIAKTNGNIVLNLDAPPETEFVTLEDMCANHRVYFVTQNNMPPAALRPWARSRYYVAHIAFDQRLAGLRTAQHLLASIGGQGGIVALSGKQNEVSSSERLAGLQAALSSTKKCFLLEPAVSAEWHISTAYDIMRRLIAEHGIGRIKGVWAANDAMALGAIEALRLYGRAVPVTGMDGTGQAIDAIQSGNMAATVVWDSFWQGGIGLALAICAKNGLIDILNETHAHRAFYAPFHFVTADNVLSFIEYRDAKQPLTDWRDFWGHSTGAIPEG